MKLDERKKEFQNPGPAFRAKPFWAWNGKLEEKELLRQVDILKEMGFGGYFMHSRMGLETEYLGEEWFSLINSCADYGHAEGMENWLYDEDRWPSGSAGGMVTRYKKYRAKFLEMTLLDRTEYRRMRWTQNLVAVFACRMEEEILYSKRRLCKGDRLEAGETAVVFRKIYAEKNDNYNGYCYVDTMSREATDYFLKITHEKYRKKCGKRLGTKIQGIFTDEPHRGPCFTEFSGGSKRRVPYTDRLFEEFASRFGYELTELLPELFLRKEIGEVSCVTRDYFELCQELFLENFAMPIQEWCRKNHMLLTGHVLHEDSLCCQATMQGSLMRYYEYMDDPGIDILSEYNTCYWAVTQVSSVARQLGKKWVLSELDGCTGWQMNFQSHKNIGDWQALLGINLRCPHLSWYTMKGEAKRDYPASILHQSPWYREYRYVEDYFSRIHTALFDGMNECRLLVMNPIESVWARAYSGCFQMLSAADPEIERLEEQYRRTYHALAAHQISFDYGEEDILARHGEVKDGSLQVGAVSYEKVLVSGMDTMRASTVALLRQFMEQGGQVIFAGEIPGWVDARPSGEVRKLAEKAVCIPFEEEEIAEACREKDGIIIQGENKGIIGVQSKKIDGGRIVMLLNLERQKNSGCFKAVLGKGSGLEEWDARSGVIRYPEYEEADGRISVTLDLEPGGERLFFLPDERDGEEPRVCHDKETGSKDESWEEIPMEEDAEYRLSEPNVCVLDYVELSLEDGCEIGRQEVLKADRSLRDHLKLPYRSGEMMQPWYSVKYCGSDADKLCMVLQNFRVNVEKIPSGVRLAVEDLNHITKIKINDQEISLSSVGKWRDICFDCLEIPDKVWVDGENQISIWMDYYKICGLEAVYLLGNFGVKRKEEGIVSIISLPEKLHFGDISYQGLPFYSGSVFYKLALPKGDYRVHLHRFGGALVKLLGCEEKVLAFEPYQDEVKDLQEVEVVLTDRNTFGPLHQIPKKSMAYGPGNFMTEGEEWSDAYQLYEQGLLERPEIRRK